MARLKAGRVNDPLFFLSLVAYCYALARLKDIPTRCKVKYLGANCVLIELFFTSKTCFYDPQPFIFFIGSSFIVFYFLSKRRWWWGRRRRKLIISILFYRFSWGG